MWDAFHISKAKEYGFYLEADIRLMRTRRDRLALETRFRPSSVCDGESVESSQMVKILRVERTRKKQKKEMRAANIILRTPQFREQTQDNLS